VGLLKKSESESGSDHLALFLNTHSHPVNLYTAGANLSLSTVQNRDSYQDSAIWKLRYSL